MTNEQARAIFTEALNNTTDADETAKIELLREYFTNPDFRKNLEDFSFANTYTK